MAVDFEKIPDCVWELFKELMPGAPENRGRPKTLKPRDRWEAYQICWGWQPALLEPRGMTARHAVITAYGLAAYAWHEQQLKKKPEQEVPLLEKVLAVLTPNQGRIMEYLWKRKTASYDTLSAIPKAWRDAPTDEAIEHALKKMRTCLNANGLPVNLTVSTAKRRVNLDLLGD